MKLLLAAATAAVVSLTGERAQAATYEVFGMDFIVDGFVGGFSTATAIFSLPVGEIASITTNPYPFLETFHDLDAGAPGFMNSAYFDDSLDPLKTLTWSGIEVSSDPGAFLIYRVSYETAVFDVLLPEEQAAFDASYSLMIDVDDGVTVSLGANTTGGLVGDPGSGGSTGVAAVPLPAGGWLLFAGLTGLGLLRRIRA